MKGYTKLAVAGLGGAAVVGGVGFAAYKVQGNAIKQTAVGKLFNTDIIPSGTLPGPLSRTHITQGVALSAAAALAVAWLLYAKVL